MRGWAALADLDQRWVAFEAEDAAAFGGDLLWGPGGIVGEGDGGLADGLEAGEAVDDLGAELGFGGVCGVGEGEGDLDAVLLGDAGDVCAGGVGVGGDGDGAEEAEVEYVAGDGGIVAVAEGAEDVGFSEHCWFDDIGRGALPAKSVQSLLFRDFRFGLRVNWV